MATYGGWLGSPWYDVVAQLHFAPEERGEALQLLMTIEALRETRRLGDGIVWLAIESLPEVRSGQRAHFLDFVIHLPECARFAHQQARLLRAAIRDPHRSYRSYLEAVAVDISSNATLNGDSTYEGAIICAVSDAIRFWVTVNMLVAAFRIQEPLNDNPDAFRAAEHCLKLHPIVGGVYALVLVLRSLRRRAGACFQRWRSQR